MKWLPITEPFEVDDSEFSDPWEEIIDANESLEETDVQFIEIPGRPLKYQLVYEKEAED